MNKLHAFKNLLKLLIVTISLFFILYFHVTLLNRNFHFILSIKQIISTFDLVEKSIFSLKKTYIKHCKRYTCWSSKVMIDSVNFLLDNIVICPGNIQVVGIPMGTNCVHLIANLFLHCHESQFMTKVYKDPFKSDFIEKYYNNYHYLDDNFSANNPNTRPLFIQRY